MAFNLDSLSTIEKEFNITYVPGIPAINEENPVVVSFREANAGDLLQRQNLTNITITQNGNDGVSWRPVPLITRQMLDIYLTMTSCDIMDGEKPLVEFVEKNGTKKVKGNFASFSAIFSKIPPALLNEIWKCCVDVNKDWDWGDVDEDEEGNLF